MTACDPLIDRRYVPVGVTFAHLDERQLAEADIVVVLTDHDDFAWDAVAGVAGKVLDARNQLAGRGVEVL